MIEIMWKPIFKENLHWSQQKLFFWLVSSVYQISLAVKTISLKGNIFLMNSSFRLVEMIFLSSRNSIVLFRALLKILKFGGSKLFKRNFISASRNWIFDQQKLLFSVFHMLLLVKCIFCLVETYSLTKFSFCTVETDFLSCGNCFLLFIYFFLQVETFTEISGNKFILERLFSGRKGFSTQWKLFSFIACFFSCKWKLLLKLFETSSLYFKQSGCS